MSGSATGGERRVAGIPPALIGPLALLAMVTAAIAGRGELPLGLLCHLYLVPALWAAWVAGMTAAGVVGLLAGLLQAPFVLKGIERSGLEAQSPEGIAGMVLPAALGLVVGRLSDQSRARAARLTAVLDVQRNLLADTPFEARLSLVADGVRAALGADWVGLAIGGPEQPPMAVCAPADSPFDARSALAWTLGTGRHVFASDLDGDPRFGGARGSGAIPRRGLVVPMGAGAGLVGALAVERRGDFPAPLRAAVDEMAMDLALAIDNARLTLRQRRFTAELGEKVAAATARLTELDRAKTEFVSVVAHELRTPLTALQGFTELLLSRAAPPERQARFLGHVHAEAQRLGRIVAELLDLSRIESGRPLALTPRPIDVAALLQRNAELFAVQNRDHRFEWSASPGLPPVHADLDAVERILKNLISNAVKYSPRGGRVRLGAEPARDRPGMVELSVEDDGVGIPAAELPRIFDKYVRIPNPETTSVRGLGLGLALVRALAEAHGGRAEVESLPGKGSIFRVLLPVRGSVLANFPATSA